MNDNILKLILKDPATLEKLKSRMELQNNSVCEFNKDIHILKSLASFELIKLNTFFAFFCFGVAFLLALMTVVQNKNISYISIFLMFGLSIMYLFNAKKLKEKYQW